MPFEGPAPPTDVGIREFEDLVENRDLGIWEAWGTGIPDAGGVGDLIRGMGGEDDEEEGWILCGGGDGGGGDLILGGLVFWWWSLGGVAMDCMWWGIIIGDGGVDGLIRGGGWVESDGGYWWALFHQVGAPLVQLDTLLGAELSPPGWEKPSEQT